MFPRLQKLFCSLDRQLSVSSADVSDVATFTESSPSYPTTTTVNHKKPCTLNETFQAKCLNNGTCFAIETGGQFRPASCSCLTGWTGKRCERKDLGPMLWDASSVAILIVFVCIIPVFIGSVYLIYYLRKRGTIPCIKKKSTDNNNQFDEPAEDQPLDTATQPSNGDSVQWTDMNAFQYWYCSEHYIGNIFFVRNYHLFLCICLSSYNFLSSEFCLSVPPRNIFMFASTAMTSFSY
jgi:hypothetical protein